MFYSLQNLINFKKFVLFGFAQENLVLLLRFIFIINLRMPVYYKESYAGNHGVFCDKKYEI